MRGRKEDVISEDDHNKACLDSGKKASVPKREAGPSLRCWTVARI